MNRFAKAALFLCFILLLIFTVRASIALIDKCEGISSFKSPSFSAEEVAREIPDGVHWILTDKDGYEFDWDAFCAEHPNCLEAFRLKGIPFPQNHSSAWGPEDDEAFYARQAEDRWQNQDDDNVGCTTDTDCRLNFGGTGGPDPRR